MTAGHRVSSVISLIRMYAPWRFADNPVQRSATKAYSVTYLDSGTSRESAE